MADREIESAAAEQARADIRIIFDQYRIAQTVQPQTRGRIRVGSLHERPNQLALASIIAVAEHHSLTVLLGAGANEKKTRDWDGQISEWKALGVDFLAGSPALPAVRGFYEARTAIIHANGHLASGQLAPGRYPRVVASLKAARIELVQQNVILDETTVLRCVITCLEFIDEVELLPGLVVPPA